MIIAIDEKDLKRMINQQVDERLKKSKEPVYCGEWLKLRKEIDKYCHDYEDRNNNRSFQTLQNFIYSAIKFVTEVSYLTDMTDTKAMIAREVFESLAEKREQMKWMN